MQLPDDPCRRMKNALSGGSSATVDITEALDGLFPVHVQSSLEFLDNQIA